MLFQVAKRGPEEDRCALSGGEAATSALFCKIMLQKPNVLVLDEPTNHLDLESINALNLGASRSMKGTVFLVTHDQDLIERGGDAYLAF